MSKWRGGGGGDCGELFRAEFLGVVGFNRCVAAFTRAREAQFHKHPQKPLVRSWENAEERVDGGNGAPRTLIMEGVS